MADRAFQFHKITREGKPLTALRIKCCECGADADFVQTGNSRLPPEAAAQKFRNLGWRVGGGPRADTCPDCLAKKPSHLKVVPMPDMTRAVDHAKRAASPSEQPPREMGFSDRRLIILKLEEVYLDEDTGYSAPWTDAKVATDLNVPRAWVTKLREENFGPEGANPEYQEFLEQIAPLVTECKNLFKAAHAQLDQAKALLEKAKPLESRIADLERIGRKVEKEIGR